MEEKKLLVICLKEIESKAALVDSSAWRHHHFELLSQKILEETNVRLSVATLKRVWGKVAYDSEPSLATLNVLAQFAGYRDWIDFQKEKSTDISRGLKSGTQSFLGHGKKRNYLFAALIILGGIIVFRQIPSPIQEELASFDFEPVAEGLPNTVNFVYDVKGTQADSMFIQQSWDSRLRHRLPEDQQFFTATYFYPGSYRAKLILNEKIVSEKDLLIKSKGWLGTIHKEPVPFYFQKEELIDENSLGFKETHLLEKGYDLNKEIPFTSLYLVGAFEGVEGNDFTLKTSFRNTFGKGSAICQKTQLFILSGDTPIILPFSIKGCTGTLTMYLPGKKLEGSNYDLSDFGVDNSDWINLEVSVTGQKFVVLINGNQVFEETLNVIPQKINGIQYKFHGTGVIKQLTVYSANKLKFQSSF